MTVIFHGRTIGTYWKDEAEPGAPRHPRMRPRICFVKSAVVIAVISAVTASTVTATLQNLRGIRVWFRKVRWQAELRTGQWWTRNEGYVPRPSRARDFRDALWYKTGPYWLNSPPPGYPADGRGPRDLLGRPMRPDKAGIVPFSN